MLKLKFAVVIGVQITRFPRAVQIAVEKDAYQFFYVS